MRLRSRLWCSPNFSVAFSQSSCSRVALTKSRYRSPEVSHTPTCALHNHMLTHTKPTFPDTAGLGCCTFPNGRHQPWNAALVPWHVNHAISVAQRCTPNAARSRKTAKWRLNSVPAALYSHRSASCHEIDAAQCLNTFSAYTEAALWNGNWV